jgi:O-antigen/teichoic acid export membrane protein
MMQTDVLMLAALRGSTSAGIYQAAFRGAELVMFSLVIVSLAIQPTLARLYASGEVARMQKVVVTGARIAFAASLPVAVLLSAFAAQLMGYIFGAEFQRGAVCLIILCFGQVICIGLGPARDILTMTGREKEAAVATAAGALANVILNAALIPLWDMEGAAIATGLSLVVWNAMLARAVYRRLGIYSTVLGPIGEVHKVPDV